MSKLLGAAGLVLSLVILSSCVLKPPAGFGKNPHWQPQYYEPGPEDLEDPLDIPEGEVLARVESVAILTFRNQTFGKGNTLTELDLVHVADEFANHLVGSGTFKTVLYPQECLEKLMGTAFDPDRRDDLKEIANLLDVDALIFGEIKQYKMYYPPELSISMRFYLTRADRFAKSGEVSRMAHVGVPLHSYDPTFFRQLWDQSAFYDASSKIFEDKLKRYLRVHPAKHFGLQEDRFKRTKADLLNFISFDLADSLDSEKNKPQRTKPQPMKKGHKKSVWRGGYYDRS